MRWLRFFENGGLVKISGKIYVSVFTLIAFAMMLVCDFSVYTAIVLTSILVHEISHVVTLEMCGGRIIRIVVYPFGADMVCDTSQLSFQKEFICVVSGGMTNILLSLVFWQVFCINDAKPALFFSVCNAFLGIANLIPFSSFDGGRALYLLLSTFLLPDRVCMIQKYIDILCLVFLCIFGVVFVGFCGFNISLVASLVYSLFSAGIFRLYKKRYI